MKVINNPTIELEEKDIETIEKLREFVAGMPCPSLDCNRCPFGSICKYVDTDINSGTKITILAIQKALNKALITE